MFPTNLLARAFGYGQREYFDVTESASARPDVAALTLIAALALTHPAPLVIAVAYAVLRCMWVFARIRRDVKKNLVSRVLAFWNPEFAYEPKGFVNEADFRLSGLFPENWKRYRGEDLVTGLIEELDLNTRIWSKHAAPAARSA